MPNNRIITVQDVPVTISKVELDDYICITDIAEVKAEHSRTADVVKKWMRNRNALEFLGTWEQIEWDAKRFLTKNNYLIQTAAVKSYILPEMKYKEKLMYRKR